MNCKSGWNMVILKILPAMIKPAQFAYESPVQKRRAVLLSELLPREQETLNKLRKIAKKKAAKLRHLLRRTTTLSKRHYITAVPVVPGLQDPVILEMRMELEIVQGLNSNVLKS